MGRLQEAHYSYSASIKSNISDEPVNVYLQRPIAGLVVRLLFNTPVTPNQVTFISTILACWELRRSILRRGTCGLQGFFSMQKISSTPQTGNWPGRKRCTAGVDVSTIRLEILWSMQVCFPLWLFGFSRMVIRYRFLSVLVWLVFLV